MINKYLINEYLITKGIKHSCLGYLFLNETLLIISNQKYRIWKLTEIYDEIAKKFNTKSSNVERCIRYAIRKFEINNKEFIVQAVYDMDILIEEKNGTSGKA